MVPHSPAVVDSPEVGNPVEGSRRHNCDKPSTVSTIHHHQEDTISSPPPHIYALQSWGENHEIRNPSNFSSARKRKGEKRTFEAGTEVAVARSSLGSTSSLALVRDTITVLSSFPSPKNVSQEKQRMCTCVAKPGQPPDGRPRPQGTANSQTTVLAIPSRFNAFGSARWSNTQVYSCPERRRVAAV